MGYQKEIFSLIAKLSGTRHKIVADPHLCQFMGGLEGGVFLSQLLFWSDKGAGEWFYKSYKEWQSEIFLSQYQVNRYAKQCVGKGFLETKLQKANGHPTVYYRVDGQKFVEAIMKFLNLDYEIFDNGISNFSQSENEKFDIPVTEITQETTTEITTEKKSSSSRVEQNLTVPQADDDDEDLNAICEAWKDAMEPKLTSHIKRRLTALAAECGPALVIRAILTSADAGGRSLRYVAKTARNLAADSQAPPRPNGHTQQRAAPAEARRSYQPPDYAQPLPVACSAPMADTHMPPPARPRYELQADLR